MPGYDYANSHSIFGDRLSVPVPRGSMWRISEHRKYFETSFPSLVLFSFATCTRGSGRLTIHVHYIDPIVLHPRWFSYLEMGYDVDENEDDLFRTRLPPPTDEEIKASFMKFWSDEWTRVDDVEDLL